MNRAAVRVWRRRDWGRQVPTVARERVIIKGDARCIKPRNAILNEMALGMKLPALASP